MLTLLVILGAIHGAIYLLVVPPWQHYDEPGHFEYVWLIANEPSFPQKGDHNEEMLRELVRSMDLYGFYGGHPLPHWDWSLDELKQLIGISQVGDPPVYYWITALPLRVIHFPDITTQLYIARGMSLLLYLVTIVSAWGVMNELLSNSKHPLSWMVPAFLVALPGLVDIMTAVNNDVGAVAFFSLFLWGGVRMIKRGFSIPGAMWLIVSTGLCWWTKNTTLVVLPLAVFALLLSLINARRRILVWVVPALGCILLAVVVMRWGDAAMWYRYTPQDYPTRASPNNTPLGERAIRLTNNPTNGGGAIRQTIPPDVVLRIRGKRVTLGAWIWANSEGKVATPIFRTYEQNRAYFNEIEVGTAPEFHAFSFTVPSDTTAANVLLSGQGRSMSMPNNIYYDGLVLIEGKWPEKQAPVFQDVDGKSGIWGGKSFDNLIRNASAEEAQPWIYPWMDFLSEKWFSITPSNLITSIFDQKGSRWYYDVAFQNLFRTFWAKFGWGNVSLIGNKPYRLLGAATAMGILGAVYVLISYRSKVSMNELLFLGIAMSGVWIPTVIRGVPTLFTRLFIPAARYSYPAIIPVALLLVTGWWAILKWIISRIKLTELGLSIIYVVGLISLALYAFATLLISF